jgi:hypothetical protein
MKRKKTKKHIDVICWSMYIVGFFSFEGYMVAGSIIAAAGLSLLLIHYVRLSEVTASRRSGFGRWLNIAVVCRLFLIVSAVAELELIKYLSTGIAGYTYACVCLKERVAY